MKKNRIVLFLFLLFALPVPAAPLPNYVGVWKYSGRDFFSVQYLSLIPKRNGDFSRSASVFVDADGDYKHGTYHSLESLEPLVPKWYLRANPALEEVNSAGDQECNFLLRNQLFPLGEMKIRKAIGEEMAPELLRNSLALLPDQVTFIEAARTLEEKDVIKLYGKIPDYARLKEKAPKIKMSNYDYSVYFSSYYHPDPNKPEAQAQAESAAGEKKLRAMRLREERKLARNFYDVKSASAWLISGQTKKGNFFIPLQNFGDGYILKKPVDRNRYPLIWELGRAAQVNQGDLNLVLQAAAMQMQSEIAQLNANIDNAFIFAHSLDEQHTKLYRILFGLTEYSGYTNDSADQVLVVSLRTLMEKLKMLNTIDRRPVKLAQLQLNQKTYHTIAFQFEGRIGLRDFSHLNSLGNLKRPLTLISPPVTLDEETAFNKGARNHLIDRGLGAGYESRYDNLFGRMENYYHQNHEYESRFSDRYDRDNYVRDRLFQNDSWAIDGIAGNAPRDAVPRFHLSLKLAVETIERKIESLNSTPPRKLAFLVRGYIGDALYHHLMQMGGEEEMIYFDPIVSRTVNLGPFMEHTTHSGGDAMSLYWLDYETAKAFSQGLPATGQPPDQNDWKEPLSGT